MFKEEIKKSKEEKSYLVFLGQHHYRHSVDIMELMAHLKRFIIGKKIRKIKDRQFKLGQLTAPGTADLPHPEHQERRL